MPPSMVETISCPTCQQRMRVPADRGRLRVRCSGCDSTFEWSLPDAAFEVIGPRVSTNAAAGTQPPPLPARAPGGRGNGLAWLILAIAVPLAWGVGFVGFGLRPAGWLEVAGLVLLLLFAPVWAVRGLSRLTGWHWAVATLPAITVYCAVLFAVTAGMAAYDDLAGMPGHFDGLDPETSSAAEVDRAMEDW